MVKGPQFIAFGGGGAPNGTDPLHEDVLLKLVARSNPTIGYCGAASDDDPDKFARLVTRLSRAGANASPIAMNAGEEAAARWIASVDAVYFGGGHSGRLVEHLRNAGWADVIMQAARGGKLLAGVSAGANCWFDWSLSDAGGSGFRPLKGLGLFSGSFCPHYSAEPDRRRVFPDLIARGLLVAGTAVDDGVGVLFRAGDEPVAFSARPGSWAYSVSRAGDRGVVSRPLAKLAAP